MVEVSRHPALNDALQEQFLKQRKAMIQHVLQQAVDRGEIAKTSSPMSSGTCCPAT